MIYKYSVPFLYKRLVCVGFGINEGSLEPIPLQILKDNYINTWSGLVSNKTFIYKIR